MLIFSPHIPKPFSFCKLLCYLHCAFHLDSSFFNSIDALRKLNYPWVIPGSHVQGVCSVFKNRPCISSFLYKWMSFRKESDDVLAAELDSHGCYILRKLVAPGEPPTEEMRVSAPSHSLGGHPLGQFHSRREHWCFCYFASFVLCFDFLGWSVGSLE